MHIYSAELKTKLLVSAVYIYNSYRLQLLKTKQGRLHRVDHIVVQMELLISLHTTMTKQIHVQMHLLCLPV